MPDRHCVKRKRCNPGLRHVLADHTSDLFAHDFAYLRTYKNMKDYILKLNETLSKKTII